jgi:hypothetical protein
MHGADPDIHLVGYFVSKGATVDSKASDQEHKSNTITGPFSLTLDQLIVMHHLGGECREHRPPVFCRCLWLQVVTQGCRGTCQPVDLLSMGDGVL